MFGKILIGNRGEIAVRIANTARRLGIATVGVYSDADRDALHRRHMDEAVSLGSDPMAYLDGDRIIAIARNAGAQAIHPGYGFLSENPDFAQDCADAGLVFIGPDPATIRAMGRKPAAKALMAKAGVSVIPGHAGDDDKGFFAAANAIGYPVLLKAAAGGGGRGMRRVDREQDLGDALTSARREAKAGFGDDGLLIEKYLESARHVEVQIFGDRHGNLVHLFSRDCSLQRRHQKLIEEAPAPGIDAALRDHLHQTALRAGRAVEYVGAGTVEFLLSAGEVYFMEMNTRLQVEHGVTEMITGIDLVAWQLRVAAGERLPCDQAQITAHGHAVEARVCAEDHEFRPSSGEVRRLRLPQGDGIRIDSGIAQGTSVGIDYDSLLLKIIAHGDDRAEALARLKTALAASRIVGLSSNLALLHRLVGDADFGNGDFDTDFVSRRQGHLAPRHGDDARIAAVLWQRRQRRAGNHPWQSLGPWRLNLDEPEIFRFRGQPAIALRPDGDEWILAQADLETRLSWWQASDDRVVFAAAGRRVEAGVEALGDALWLWIDGEVYAVVADDPRTPPPPRDPGADKAPMPGRISRIVAPVGSRVKAGDPVLLLEAMKMEHAVRAPYAGVVLALHVGPGDQVAEGALLFQIVGDEQP